ncbi:MAG TPA: hypothetical protein DCF33_08695, partial [Saprospirales bacterium]|nr:hypothetical protein [Saprospirales bacterium]
AGENGRFHPTPDKPLKLYSGDIDQNGQIDQVLTYYLKDREIPFATFEEYTKTIPSLKKKYLYARDFAKASAPEVFGKQALSNAKQRKADTFTSYWFENTGGLNFVPHALPASAQFSTLNAFCPFDIDRDGKTEVLSGGNFFECNIEMGRYDASYGQVLQLGSGGNMNAYTLGNLRIDGQIRRISLIELNGQNVFV